MLKLFGCYDFVSFSLEMQKEMQVASSIQKNSASAGISLQTPVNSNVYLVLEACLFKLLGSVRNTRRVKATCKIAECCTLQQAKVQVCTAMISS